MSKIELSQSSSEYFEELCNHLCSLSKQNQKVEEKAAQSELLLHLLLSFALNVQAYSPFFGQGHKNGVSLLKAAWPIVLSEKMNFESQNSYYFGSYLNAYEELVWSLLLILENLQKSLLRHNEKELNQLTTIITEDMSHILNSNLKAIVKRKYYSVMYQLANSDENFRESVLNKWNFSQVPLKEYLSKLGEIDVHDLSENLSFTQKLLSAVFETDADREHIFSLEFSTTLNYVHKYFISPSDDPLMLNKLKYIATFVLKMVQRRTHYYKKLHSKILVPFAKFFTEKRLITRWNANSIKQSFYIILENTINFHVCLDQSILDLLSTCNEQIEINKIISATLLPDDLLWKKDEIRKIIVSSIKKQLEELEECIFKDWSRLGSPKLDRPQQIQEFTVMSLKCQRFVYFTLQDLTAFVLAFKSSPKESEEYKLAIMLIQKTGLIYSHLAIYLLTGENEKMMIRSSVTAIIEASEEYGEVLGDILWKELNNTLKLVNEDTEQNTIPDAEQFTNLYGPHLEDYYLPLVERASDYFLADFSAHIRLAHLTYELSLNIDTLVKAKSQDPHDPIKQRPVFFKEIKALLKNSIAFILNSSDPLTHKNFGEKASYKAYLIKALKVLHINIYTAWEPSGSNKHVLSLLSSFFSDLLNSITRSPFEIQIVLIDVIIELSINLKTSSKQQIFSLILCHKEIWPLLLRRLSKATETKILRSEGADNAKATKTQEGIILLLFVETLLVYFRSKSNMEHIENTLKIYRKPISLHMRDLFTVIGVELNKFPMLELALLNDSVVDQTLHSVLQIYEKCYLYTKAESLRYINEAEKAVVLLSNQMSNQEKNQQVDTIVGKKDLHTVEVINKGELEVKKQLQNAENRHEDLKLVDQTLDDQINSKLRFHALFYSFDYLEKFSKRNCDSFKSRNLFVVSHFLNRYCYQILEGYDYLTKEQYNNNEHDLISDDSANSSELVLDMNITKNATLNKLLDFQNYLHRFISFLADSIKDIPLEESFIWRIYRASMILMSELHIQAKNNSLDVREAFAARECDTIKIEDFIADLSGILLRYFTNRSPKYKVSLSSAALSIFDWTAAVINLESFIRQSLSSRIIYLTKDSFCDLLSASSKYIQSSSCFNVEFLHNHFDALLLAYSASTGTDRKHIFNSIAFLLDDFIGRSFGEEIMIETKIKQIFMMSPDGLNSHRLSTLKDIFSMNRGESSFDEKLASVIINKFIVFSETKNQKDKSDFDLIHVNVSLSIIILLLNDNKLL